MRNVRTENVSEHSLQVAMVPMRWQLSKIENLAVMSTPNDRFTGDVPRCLRSAHRRSPYPVKYFNSQIAQEYKAIEKIASKNWSIWFRKSCGISLRR